MAKFMRRQSNEDEKQVTHLLKSEKQAFPQRTYHVKPDPSIEITEEFSKAATALETSATHAFITGKAGTGKSTLLQYIRQKTQKKVVVLAPTGIAAVTIGGSTLHSFFKFPPHFLQQKDIRRNEITEALYRSIDLLLIDEVSMVRPDLLDAIDYTLRLHRDQKKKPFGGVQVALFGDLFQLPPVVEHTLQEFFYQFYDTPYFFSAKILGALSVPTYELQTIFRQTDPVFIGILNRIRTKSFTADDLVLINERVYPNRQHPFGEQNFITLTSTNAVAARINREKLKALKGPQYVYDAEIAGDFPETAYPTEEHLVLKKGAQVIMLKNDPAKRWFNGTIATVQKLSEASVAVLIDGEEHEVEPVTWERIIYEYKKETETVDPIVTGTFRQYPLTLAWAITIHKSQGKTFNRVVINLGWGTFAHGQVYVALSRCTSLEGLCLHTPIHQSDIIVDDRIIQFLSSSQQPLSTFRLR